MARRGSPALYELLGRKRENGSAPVTPSQIPNRAPAKPSRGGISIGPGSVGASGTAAGAARSEAGATSSQPGSSGAAAASRKTSPAQRDPGASHSPAFQAFGFAAVALLVLVMVYFVGVSRGRQAERSATDGTSDVDTPSTLATGVSGDGIGAPASAAPGVRSGGQPTVDPRSENAVARQSSAPIAAPAQTAPMQAGGELGDGGPLPPAQRGIDPRQAGLHYCVIASVLESNADKIVGFCRERGLDAWVVPDHNGRLREITVLPGILKSELKGPKAKSLEERIRKVGQQWKAAGRGNSDFEDRYFKLFNG